MSAIERIIASIIVASIVGLLFTLWAEGKWDPQTFIAFFIAAFLLTVLPRPGESDEPNRKKDAQSTNINTTRESESGE